MSNVLEGWRERHRTDALRELTKELGQFSHDGLILLRRNLRDGTVIRGSWTGCVLSYRRGEVASARTDRQGRARNAFTRLWDAGVLTDEEVLTAVVREIARRRRRAASAAPASVPTRPPAYASGRAAVHASGTAATHAPNRARVTRPVGLQSTRRVASTPAETV